MRFDNDRYDLEEWEQDFALLENGELQTLLFTGNENTGRNNFGFASSNADLHKSFNTYRISEGIDYFSSNVTYIFFTKPQMNVFDEEIDSDFIKSLQENKDTSSNSFLILDQLDGLSSTRGCFNMLLSNTAESFDLKDNILKTKEIGTTRMGSKIMLGDNSMDSYNSDNFTIEYTELSDLSITKLHKAWVDYIHLVKHNQAKPHKEGGTKNLINERVIDYACSVYYFRTAEDGCTIKYWAKYTGVFPLNVPFSAMSFSLGENKLKQISVNYTYSFKEDMNTSILLEFQNLCNSSGWATSATNNVSGIADNWAEGVCLDPTFNKLIFVKKPLGYYV